MTTQQFELANVHPSWQACLRTGLAKLDTGYLTSLAQSSTWLPGADNIFNAFSLPLENVNYVLFGESPYPRAISANGYAFWDAAVKNLWSPTGLSKEVNRATSLRNIIKMLLICDGRLTPTQTTQEAIATLNKQDLVQTNAEFFGNFLQHGFLLLNATPVLHADDPKKDARAWQPFINHVLTYLLQQRPQVTFVLLGRIATTIDTLIPSSHAHKLYAEHPYNLSFITNPKVQAFFRPLQLLYGHSTIAKLG
jgi:uracil-DNA glycosylase